MEKSGGDERGAEVDREGKTKKQTERELEGGLL